MQRSEDRILTSHVGSLIRPPELVEYLRALDEGGEVNDDEFRECFRKSVARVAQQQADIGLDIINDGDFGKMISWSRYIVERLEGFEHQPQGELDKSLPAATRGKDRRDFAEFYEEYDRQQGFTRMSGWRVTGPICYKGHKALEENIRDLKAALADLQVEEGFMTAVAPASVVPDREDHYYQSDEEYVFAIAEALREEYRSIVDAGLILQVDDAYLALYYDVMVPPGTLEDYRAWAGLRVDALNHALSGLPEDRVRYHVCWGSWNAPHVSDVPLGEIVDLILEIRAGGYCIEMANPRHEHEWRIWEEAKLPEGKVLLPGVISHATNVVEHPELVAERIVRLAGLVGRENIIAGTDCGFAQGPFVRRVHPSIQWAKLEALVEGARLASRKLWK